MTRSSDQYKSKKWEGVKAGKVEGLISENRQRPYPVRLVDGVLNAEPKNSPSDEQSKDFHSAP